MPNDETGSPEQSDTWDRLTAPFPQDWVEKLPKALKARDDDKGTCREGSRYSADGHFCGKYHARAVHLDYIGHAGITMRLNDVLGPGGWDFQPMATTAEGLPVISQSVFWAKLAVTVDGETVTKWELATNYSGPQEALGDALRRCAMRFGIGTYLWAKSEHAAALASFTEEPEPEPTPEPEPLALHQEKVAATIRAMHQDMKDNLLPWWTRQQEAGNLPDPRNLRELTEDQAQLVLETVGHIQAHLDSKASQEQDAQESGRESWGEAAQGPQ